MGINLYCPTCYKSFKLGTKICTCKHSFVRNKQYRVRIKIHGKWKTKTAPSLEKAKLIEAKFKLQAQRIIKRSISPTIESVWEPYLIWAKFNKRSWIDDRIRWIKHVAPYLTGELSKIKPSDIQFILTNMAEMDSPRGGKYKPGTIKLTFALIRRVINWSIEQGFYQGSNPCNTIKIPYFDNQVTNPLNKKGLKSLLKVLDHWNNERAVHVIKFALYSGKRKGEILSLTWDCLDLENNFITFKATNMKNKKVQTIPINKTCIAILKRCLEIKISDFVFPSTAGNFYSTLPKTWKRIKKNADINIRFHDLRHTYASYLASSGKVDIYTLKELLGHSTLEMTQRYAHLVNGALRKAVNVADNVFTL